ncbi:bifunctional phosphopantothenoylcysteine decarboxylase/phosphopantothenate--cysteine ligase CoaBC [Geodermatophilus sp. SYSU D01119]
MSRIVLGVGGGVAAYKSALLLRALTEAGHDVRVVPTESALRFVGAATFEALSGNPVTSDVWHDVPEVAHVRIGQTADLVVVNPATADLLARAASGRADDLLTATLLTAHCPVVFVPAMHTEMWLHPATRDNVATLRRRGSIVLPPAVGRLTGPDSGPGRLPEPADVAALAQVVLAAGADALRADLTGRRVVISAGGTREPLDPVRYLGNRSSGKQGWALARVAAARGADVTLVAANVELPAPFGVRVVPVGTAEELRAAMLAEAPEADVVVMSAAVADFRPATVAATKLKKKDDPSEVPEVRLVRNPDVLAELVTKRTPGQLVVGFAAETGDADGDVLAHARAKLARKGCDLLVVNDVSGGGVFGRPDNAAVVLSADGTATDVPHGSKDAVAAAVWQAIAPRPA